jgi:uncharacterized protein YdeI (YjbR/CyaY-like superfamily)
VVVPDPRSIRAFRSAKAFEAWLAANHANKTEVYLRIYKKGSGKPTVTHPEALDVALCWGWIDAIRKAYDEESFLQRFAPRGAKSIWSQINREHVARLTAAGRMTEHGAAKVEAAKADGRWQAAYAGARHMTIPEDLQRAIDANRAARTTFDTLSKQNLYALSFRLGNLKTPASRQKKIAGFVDMLARGETPHPNRRAARKT